MMRAIRSYPDGVREILAKPFGTSGVGIPVMIPRKRPGLQRDVAVLGAFATVAVGMCAWPYTVDDAFIVARYATRLAAGYGYTFNGNSPSDGVTGPLWLLPGLVAARLGLDPVAAAKLLGLAAMALAVALTLRRLQRRSGGDAAAWIALALVVVQPAFGTWGVAGLETGAATLSMVLGLDALLARPRPRVWRLGACVAVLAWLRPELALPALTMLVALGVRVGARAAAPAWCLAAASALGTCAFRYALFDHLLPLALSAKLGTLADGAGYALRGIVILTSGVGVALAIIGGVKGRSDERIVLSVLATHVASVILAGGDWMPGFRLFAPLLPAYAALAAVGAQRLASRSRVRAVLSAALIAGACSIPLIDLVTRMADLRSAGHSRQTQGHALALWLRANARCVALIDIGYLGYTSSVEVMDLAGITDAEIARLPGGHLDKRIPDALFAERTPDVIVLHAAGAVAVDTHERLASLPGGYAVEQRVARSTWVRRNFRVARVVRYAPGYDYVVLQRVRAAQP